jgi:hypothetical protein
VRKTPNGAEPSQQRHTQQTGGLEIRRYHTRDTAYAPKTPSTDASVNPSTSAVAAIKARYACRAGVSLHILPHLLKQILEIIGNNEPPFILSRFGHACYRWAWPWWPVSEERNGHKTSDRPVVFGYRHDLARCEPMD